jgi:hypothetical protein
MLRRNRPPRRGLARPYLRAARAALRLERDMRPSLYQAHQWMTSGEYLAAADQFERLAAHAMARGMVERAPFLYLQASRARLHCGQPQASLALLRQGLGLLAELQRWAAVQRHGQRMAWEYEQLGHAAQAAEVRKWLAEAAPAMMPGAPAGQNAAPEMPHAQLPAKCPYCGGNVLPDEVSWVDAASAECVYCGSILRATE